jgi:hypothetical protein
MDCLNLSSKILYLSEFIVSPFKYPEMEIIDIAANPTDLG